MSLKVQIRFAAEHPAFAGHFPGTPIVPGVLLLAEALARLAQDHGSARPCTNIISAKFLRPVGPEELVEVELRSADAQHSHLELRTGGALVATARLQHSAAGTGDDPHA